MNASPSPPVVADRLTRDFGPVRAVEDLSFRVESGEIVGLLGPNGAGKTTTLRMLTGSLIPSSGRVELGGFDVLLQGPEARKRLGYLPERLPFYAEMTVVEYLRFVGSIKGIKKRLIGDALESVRSRLDLDAVWGRPTHVLSRGYRQRVGLAQALIGDPELLILDEPTAGLDPNQIHDFRALVGKLGEDHAILLSTHILPEAIEVCDRVMIMNQGRLVAMDQPDRLLGDGSGTAMFVGRVRSAQVPELGAIEGKIEKLAGENMWRIEGRWNEAEGSELLATLVRQGVSVLEWRRGASGLEEVFRRLTLGEDLP